MAIQNCLDEGYNVDDDADGFAKCVIDQIPEGVECYDCMCESIYDIYGIQICGLKKQLKVELVEISATVEADEE